MPRHPRHVVHDPAECVTCAALEQRAEEREVEGPRRRRGLVLTDKAKAILGTIPAASVCPTCGNVGVPFLGWTRQEVPS